MQTFDTIIYESPAEHIARIVLHRPGSRNAQDTRLLYELNDAFDIAAQDDLIRVIILSAQGPHFSSGHDLREANAQEQMQAFRKVGTWGGYASEGSEAQMAREKELYYGLCERWRSIPKPTLAQVQGKCIAGGLMLIWPCDIIVASSDAEFSDPSVAMGVGGVEFFAHPWELGIRRAKELLFTGGWISAREALHIGMVNHVVAQDQLAAFTLSLAQQIAKQPPFAIKLVKEAINAAQDAQGRSAAMRTAFALHQLAHSHNMLVHGTLMDPSGLTKPK